MNPTLGNQPEAGKQAWKGRKPRPVELRAEGKLCAVLDTIEETWMSQSELKEAPKIIEVHNTVFVLIMQKDMKRR